MNLRQASSACSVCMASKFRSGMARLKKGVGISPYILTSYFGDIYMSVQIGLNLLWMAPCFVLFLQGRGLYSPDLPVTMQLKMGDIELLRLLPLRPSARITGVCQLAWFCFVFVLHLPLHFLFSFAEGGEVSFEGYLSFQIMSPAEEIQASRGYT